MRCENKSFLQNDPGFLQEITSTAVEVRLEAAAQERNPRTRLEPETLRTILLLLYGAGLRVGEALQLHPWDVNFQDRVLSICNTKFFKSRLVPIGARLTAA